MALLEVILVYVCASFYSTSPVHVYSINFSSSSYTPCDNTIITWNKAKNRRNSAVPNICTRSQKSISESVHYLETNLLIHNSYLTGFWRKKKQYEVWRAFMPLPCFVLCIAFLNDCVSPILSTILFIFWRKKI